MKKFQDIALWTGIILANLISFFLWYWFKNRFEYAHEGYFYLLVLIPLLSLWYFFNQNKNQPEIKLSTLQAWSVKDSPIAHFRHGLFIIRMGALSLLIIALARPQSSSSWEDVSKEGIDIIISMDVSASMLARDFSPNRLEASKQVAIDFIKGRPNDRIGLVVYEGESFTQCPLTTDHRILINLFQEIKSGLIEGGTAIGMGLATAVNRLRESEAASKVVILLTDGENNSGSVSPVTAAEIAKDFDVRVYTIGVGTHGRAMAPTAIYPDGSYRYESVEVKIDEKVLQEIANLTGGSYFRATNNNSLKDIYQEIDNLEKTRFNVTRHSKKAEKFYWFGVAAAGLILLEFLFRNSVLRTAP